MNADSGGFDSARGKSARDWGRVTVWLAGLLVAAGAIAATAHGLFEVARAASVPGGIGWLYPVITDGLALVAYVATTRLAGHGRSYAWSVVVLAASLSGLAQASFLAGGVAGASTVLRFGVGAWPAVAAALAAHLLFLLAHIGPTTSGPVVPDEPGSIPASVHHPVQDDHQHPVHGDLVERVDRPTIDQLVRSVPGVPIDHVRGVPGVPIGTPQSVPIDHELVAGLSQLERPVVLAPTLSPADRAFALAELHRRREGRLPSVRELLADARVSQGTAGRVLQELRERPSGLPVPAEPSVSGVPDLDQEENS